MTYADFDEMHNVYPGCHFYQFYKSSADYLKVLTSFFRAGFEKGQAGLWLVSSRIGIEAVSEYASEHIPDFAVLISMRQLVVSQAEDWYQTDGRFDQERVHDRIGDCVSKMQERGFSMCRVAGDAYAVPKEDWNQLRAYEEKNTQLLRDNQTIGLCAYPILECSISDTHMVLECHDGVLVGKI